MNADRRASCQVCIELIKECSLIGEMSDASHKALEEVINGMKKAEYWSLRNQSKHEGRNPSTDQQIAVSRVALPALEAAATALANEDYTEVVDQLMLAVTTDGKVLKKSSRKDW